MAPKELAGASPARVSLPVDPTLAFASPWPHIRRIVAVDDVDDFDGEWDACAPPGWPPPARVQFPADLKLTLQLPTMPAPPASRLDARSTGADCAGGGLTGGPLDEAGILCARDGSQPADFNDSESQRVLDAAARTLARELGRQAARELWAQVIRR
jgi:hypothetical protein